MPVSEPKILVVRNDKLGDFMLSLPVFAALKSNLDQCELHALVPEYTQEMAAACPWIDHIILDPGRESGIDGLRKLSQILRGQQYHAAIILFSTTRIALATLFAGIPFRFAPATKIAQVLYNRRVTQRRSRSLKPEYEYNLDLAYAYLHSLGIDNPVIPSPPYLTYPDEQISKIKNEFITTYSIPADKRLVFIHAGSGGSANNLNLQQYGSLIRYMSTDPDLHFVLSGGPAEQEQVETLSRQMQDISHSIFISRQGLDAFAKHIAIADLFIAGSTGPLHIAGALDIPTVGFYPRRRSSTALRWQTLNNDGHRLTFSPPEYADEQDMSMINIRNTADKIREFLEKLRKY
ncbi:glycosyltransferase family 9 protein [Thiohalophilus sp.]|uniref:glycosyltransferase family 9 protein n=1 Tax=Thiohalophilus sp. TaxID=3028392 RepID=UPI0039749894